MCQFFGFQKVYNTVQRDAKGRLDSTRPTNIEHEYILVDQEMGCESANYQPTSKIEF